MRAANIEFGYQSLLFPSLSTTVSQHPYENLPFVLVSGQARSGTTVLTKAIGEHPEVYSNGKESNYVADVARLLKKNLDKPHVVSELIESPDHFVGQFRTALFSVLFPKVLLSKPQHDGTHKNLKSELSARFPSAVSTFSSLQIEMAESLKILFPKFLVANIVRNGIEVVASRMSHESIGKFSFENHCTAWAHSIHMARWGESNDSLFLIRHEQLMNSESAASVFETLQQRIGITQSTACAEFVTNNQINSSFNSNDSESRRVELQNRTERWREWSETQRQTFEEICSETMNYFGYLIPWKLELKTKSA